MVIANMVSLIILIFGGLNWVLAGIFKLDIINLIFGRSIVAMILYGIIGVAALYLIASMFMTGGKVAICSGNETSGKKSSSKSN